MQQANISAKDVTTEHIQQWKEKYGDIFKVEVDGKACFLKKPDRKTLGYASTVKDTIKYNEIVLNGSWLAGDEELKTNDSLFFAVSAKLGELIETKEADLVKL